jgi:hypothetical protein
MVSPSSKLSFGVPDGLQLSMVARATEISILLSEEILVVYSWELARARAFEYESQN